VAAADESGLPSRRRLGVWLGAGLLAGALGGRSAAAAAPRRLRLFQVHTRESFDAVYHDGERLLEAAVEPLAWFMRDHHLDLATEMDPGVYDLLWRLSQRYLRARGHQVTINVHSAFRSEETNARLRSEGAALDSYHLRGQAVDVSVQGYGIHFLANHARAIATGGLGIYWRAGYCHFDTGPPRFWYRR